MDAQTKIMANRSEHTLLAIETATAVCSVVLSHKGKSVERRAMGRSVHSDKLFLFIDELLKEQRLKISDLDAVLVSAGPGSYTGLRIAASGVKGLLFEREVPLFAVNTLASFARTVSAMDDFDQGSLIHSVIDARRSHLYHAAFHFNEESGLTVETEVADRHLETVSEWVKDHAVMVGTGISRLDNLEPGVRTFGKDQINAHAMIQLYTEAERYNYVDSVIQEVDLVDFDPRYYTSNQVARKD
jgi:tRNA threonylcarbamoyladenosine biosynthesis protein TsaB